MPKWTPPSNQIYKVACYTVYMQAAIHTLLSDDVPQALRELTDPPQQLFAYSEDAPAELLASRPVAIVGTRRPTGYGRRIAGMLAARLASAGAPVVSGLAFGIDTCAHRAVVDAGGQSIAVLPGGVDRESVSPRSNLGLAEQIITKGGVLVSELPNGTSARKHYYASRNRLISGMARAVVVIEAAIPSGTLVTAQHAADQNKELWAVPGPIDSPASAGSNRLIRDGAHPLTSIDEFLEALGIQAKLPPASGLLAEVADGPIYVDELATRTSRAIADLETELTKLELRGLIRKQDDGAYVRG